MPKKKQLMTILKWPLYIWILIFMVLGALWGLIAVNYGAGEFHMDWIAPFGDIFLKLLKFIAVPLVITSIISGIISLKDVDNFAGIAWKTLLIYIVTTAIAISIGLAGANMFRPGDELAGIEISAQNDIVNDLVKSQNEGDAGPLDYFVEMIPENFFLSASNNSAMLQVILASVLLGIAILSIPHNKRPVLTSFIDELADVFIKMIFMVMKMAPLGVFALLGTVIVSFGADKGVFIGMGKYVLVVLGGLFLLILCIYPVLNYLFTGMNPFRFIRGIFPAQLLAFSTSSSAATLPLTTLQVRNKLGVSEEVSGFVLPLGMTVNMDGTSLYQAVSAVFIAQIFQIDLSVSAQLTILFTALLASIGSPAIPGGSIVMMIVVLSSVGIPAEGLALILGVDRFLDMCRTMTNVTGDAMVSCIVEKLQKKK